MRLSVTSASLVLALSAVLACDDDDDVDGAAPTVVEVAEADGNFETLVSALEATGLDETLAGQGPFTVFAPTDAAFDRLPAGTLAALDTATLADILSYHVVPGRVPASEVLEIEAATTLEGSDVSVDVFDGTVVLDGTVQVVTTDIQAGNGVIHVIDAVLLPPDVPFPGDLVAAAQAYPTLDTLVGAVVVADLVGALQGGDGELTVFAPTDFAFAELDIDIDTLEIDVLVGILLYHVIGASVPAAELVGLGSVTTLEGGDITVDAAGEVFLNGDIRVIQTDLRTDNGIIHVIDGVLLPGDG
jgi:transforming growth factor-beta-induced protein